MHGNTGNKLCEVELNCRLLWDVYFPVFIHFQDDASQKDELTNEHQLRLVDRFGKFLSIELEFLDVLLIEAHDREVVIV
jgi:hypothetical protein